MKFGVQNVETTDILGVYNTIEEAAKKAIGALANTTSPAYVNQRVNWFLKELPTQYSQAEDTYVDLIELEDTVRIVNILD